MRCSVFLCCGVLQCAVVCCSVLQCVAAVTSLPLCRQCFCVAVCYSALQHFAAFCSVLQCDAVCCNLLQFVAALTYLPEMSFTLDYSPTARCVPVLQCVATCCSVLRCFALCCSVLQRVAACCSVLQCVVACCSVLQCVAVCCSGDISSPLFQTGLCTSSRTGNDYQSIQFCGNGALRTTS